MGQFRCWSVKNVLDLFVDGRLTEKAASRIDFHLKECSSCREVHKSMMGVKNIFCKSARAQTPEALAASILEKLNAENVAQDESARPAYPSLPELLRGRQLSPAQAALLVYLALLAGTQMGMDIPSQNNGIAPPWMLEKSR